MDRDIEDRGAMERRLCPRAVKRRACFFPLLLVGALMLQPAGAQADPAVCFPERVVMTAAWIRDDAGRIVAGVRSGREVKIIEEGAADHHGDSLVELTGSFEVRGWVAPKHLLVFAREDLETVAETEWWLAEAPLRIYGGEGQFASVACTECRGIFAAQGEELKVPCTALRGTLPKEPMRTDGNGARGKTPSTSSGKKIHALEDDLTLDLDSGEKQKIGSSSELYLLGRQGGRAKVEAFDLPGWTRTRGTVDASRVAAGAAALLGWGSSGCAGDFEDPVVRPGVPRKLLRNVTMTASIDGGKATPLPAGASVELLARFADKFFAIWPDRDAKGAVTLVVVGWIAGDAIKDTGTFPKFIAGQLRAPSRQTVASWDEFQLTVRSGPLRFDGPVDAKGRFRAPVAIVGGPSGSSPTDAIPAFDRACRSLPSDEAVHFTARSRDGLWMGDGVVKVGQLKKPVVVNVTHAPAAP